MTESLGERIKARRDARLAAAESAATQQSDHVPAAVKAYVDEQIRALAAANDLTAP